MFSSLIQWIKKRWQVLRLQMVAGVGKWGARLLVATCRIEIEGLYSFLEISGTHRCIVMLWHNRLALVPWFLSHYTSQRHYAALVSGSRDGAILSAIIQSHANGETIRVSHQARHHALREVYRIIAQQEAIVIMTPDGPRGPPYQMKGGIVAAARETQAQVVALNWEAAHYWELPTWDRLRLPRPFTTIRFSFSPAVQLDRFTSLEEGIAQLRAQLPIL